jgi:hypothetical protein
LIGSVNIVTAYCDDVDKAMERLHKLRVLFDSGSSGSIIVAKFIKKLRINKLSSMQHERYFVNA